MLPSKGAFSSINCPFYDSGLCERPFCHFRHVARRVPSLPEVPPATSVHDKGAGVPAYTPTPLAELNMRRRRHIPVVACTSINVYPPTARRKRRSEWNGAETDWKRAATSPPPSYNFYIGGGGEAATTTTSPLSDVMTIVRRVEESLPAPAEVFGRRKPPPVKPFYYGTNIDDDDDDAPETDPAGFYDNLAEADVSDTLNRGKPFSAGVYDDGKERAAVNKLNVFGFEENLTEADEHNTLNHGKPFLGGDYCGGKERAAVKKLNFFGIEENPTDDERDILNTGTQYCDGKEKEAVHKLNYFGFGENLTEATEIDTLNPGNQLSASVYCNGQDREVANKPNYFRFEENLMEEEETDTLKPSNQLSTSVYCDRQERKVVKNLNYFGLKENFTEAVETEFLKSSTELSASVYCDEQERKAVSKPNYIPTPIGNGQLGGEPNMPNKNESTISEENISLDFDHALLSPSSKTLCDDKTPSQIEHKSKHKRSNTKPDQRHSRRSTTTHSKTTKSSKSKSRSKNNQHTSSKQRKSSSGRKSLSHSDVGKNKREIMASKKTATTKVDTGDSLSHSEVSKNKREATATKKRTTKVDTGDSSSHNEVSKNKRNATVTKDRTTKADVGDSVSHPRPKAETPPEVNESRFDPPDQVPHKKRVAHGAALGLRVKALQRRPASNPSLTMAKRYEIAKQRHERKLVGTDRPRGTNCGGRSETRTRPRETEGLASTSDDGATNGSRVGQPQMQKPFDPPCLLRLQKLRSMAALDGDKATGYANPPGKVRIAHVQNVAKILEEKDNVRRYSEVQRNLRERKERRAEAMRRHDEHARARTLARTVPNGARREAHAPRCLPLDDMPTIAPEPGTKVPVFTRQRKLDVLVDEYLVVHEKEDSYRLAVEREREIYERATSLMTYSSLVTSAVLRIRQDVREQTSNFRINVLGIGTKPPAAGDGARAEGRAIYAALNKFVLTESQLVENGFPRVHPDREGSTLVKLRYGYDEPVAPSRRRCGRCSVPYEVDALGFQTSSESCLYHERRPQEGRYRCCNEGYESAGCCLSPSHVCSNFRGTNYGFRRTVAPLDPDGDHGVYAVDCEMSYTTLGVELTRVTVVDHDCATVLDTFVRPDGAVVDYNTRFSGVSEADLEGVGTTVADVQDRLAALVSARTILVGHSLDSDLRALKLIHDACVDTSVVYPHPDGAKKRALRTLAGRILHRAIQQGDRGHDSAEDAVAAMELMLHKIGRRESGAHGSLVKECPTN